MKKILFICSHLYSGSSLLCESLSNHSHIQKYNFSPYLNPESLILLSEQKHKLNNRAAIHMDELLYNYDLSTKIVYKECNFIYVLRSPEMVLKSMIIKDKIKLSFAAKYYVFRLRRLYEMSKQTPGAILLTWEDLKYGRGVDLIEKYLGVNQISYNDFGNESFNFSLPSEILSKAEDSYQQYLYFLKHQKIIYCE